MKLRRSNIQFRKLSKAAGVTIMNFGVFQSGFSMTSKGESKLSRQILMAKFGLTSELRLIISNFNAIKSKLVQHFLANIL